MKMCIFIVTNSQIRETASAAEATPILALDQFEAKAVPRMVTMQRNKITQELRRVFWGVYSSLTCTVTFTTSEFWYIIII
jgi:hypothetical protein